MSDQSSLKHHGASCLRHAAAAFTLVEIMIVVTIIGILATMAVPAFQKVRALAQDNTVRNNLRQLTAGANVYFLEMGVSSVNSTTLVGSNSSQYVSAFSTVANETYAPILMQGSAVTASGIAGQRTVTFGL
jgi:type IV pilus assembly protein PilA